LSSGLRISVDCELLDFAELLDFTVSFRNDEEERFADEELLPFLEDELLPLLEELLSLLDDELFPFALDFGWS
jgi:hypothetical protein